MANPHGTQGTQGQGGTFKEKAENTGAGLGAAAGRKFGEAAERAQQAGTSAAETARETASGVAQKAQDIASNVGQKVQETASNVAQKAQDLASTAKDRADDALSSMGERMSGWGHSLRETAPRAGTFGTAASSVAGQLEAGGQYLQQHGLGDIADEFGGLVRRYPIQSLLVAFGVGCLIGLANSRR